MIILKNFNAENCTKEDPSGFLTIQFVEKYQKQWRGHFQTQRRSRASQTLANF